MRKVIILVKMDISMSFVRQIKGDHMGRLRLRTISDSDIIIHKKQRLLKKTDHMMIASFCTTKII